MDLQVEELKTQESRDIGFMNRQYKEYTLSRKNEEINVSAILANVWKNARIKQLNLVIASKELEKKWLKQILTAWKRNHANTICLRKKEAHVMKFAEINLMRRAMNELKYELGFTGNRLYKFKCETEAEN